MKHVFGKCHQWLIRDFWWAVKNTNILMLFIQKQLRLIKSNIPVDFFSFSTNLFNNSCWWFTGIQNNTYKWQRNKTSNNRKIQNTEYKLTLKCGCKQFVIKTYVCINDGNQIKKASDIGETLNKNRAHSLIF